MCVRVSSSCPFFSTTLQSKSGVNKASTTSPSAKNVRSVSILVQGLRRGVKLSKVKHSLTSLTIQLERSTPRSAGGQQSLSQKIYCSSGSISTLSSSRTSGRSTSDSRWNMASVLTATISRAQATLAPRLAIAFAPLRDGRTVTYHWVFSESQKGAANNSPPHFRRVCKFNGLKGLGKSA